MSNFTKPKCNRLMNSTKKLGLNLDWIISILMGYNEGGSIQQSNNNYTLDRTTIKD